MNTLRNIILAGALLCAAAFASGGSITVQWRDNSTNEKGFKVEGAVGDGPFTQIGTTAADVVEFVHEGLVLVEGERYSYRVRAYNPAGNSAYSNIAVYEVPYTIPNAPDGTKATGAPSATVTIRMDAGDTATVTAVTETGAKVKGQVTKHTVSIKPGEYAALSNVKK